MNIQEYVAEERKMVEDFIDWWLTQNKIDSECFPLEMEPGEWGEQYLAFWSSVTDVG